jgi:carbon-monoxide dehydrogenase small subunit
MRCYRVLVDDKALPACMVLAVECDGKDATTIEGLRDPKAGTLYPVQQMFIDHTAFQCGFCTPGIIMGARPLSRNAYKVEIARTLVEGQY